MFFNFKIAMMADVRIRNVILYHCVVITIFEQDTIAIEYMLRHKIL